MDIKFDSRQIPFGSEPLWSRTGNPEEHIR